MMNDIEKAVSMLEGYTLVLVKGERQIVSDKKGIAPMMELIGQGEDLQGYAAADVVGRAAALLFVYKGIDRVYAGVVSKAALEIFDIYKVTVTYNKVAEYIINRAGTGMCPMEQAVLNETDPEKAYRLLLKQYEKLAGKMKTDL